MQTNIDVVELIAEHVRFEPLRFLELAEVNRTFHQVFTSDKHWRQFDVYGVKKGIYRHFVESLDPVDKKIFRAKIMPSSDFNYLTPEDFANGACSKYILAIAMSMPILEISSFEDLQKDLNFTRAVVKLHFPAYLGLNVELARNDPEICVNLFRKGNHLGHPDYFEEECPLSSDKNFCKQVIDPESPLTWGYEYDHPQNYPLKYFSEEVTTDFDILDIATKRDPSAILYAKKVTQELVDRYVPTEESFLQIIRGVGKLVGPFLPYYNNLQVIATAYEGIPYYDFGYRLCCENMKEMLEYFDRPEDVPKDLSALDDLMHGCYFSFDRNARGHLPKDRATARILLVLWSEFQDQASRDILDLLDPEVLNDKEFIFEVLKMHPYCQFNFKMWTLLRPEFNAVLEDPVYAAKLLQHNWLWYHQIRTPITKELVQILLKYHPDDKGFDDNIYPKAYKAQRVKDLQLPDYALGDTEILKLATGRFANIKDAPPFARTRKVAAKSTAKSATKRKRARAY